MTHALTDFLVERTDQLGLSPADLARASGLSRQVCWNWITDDREKLSRLPAPSTLEAFAKALHVPKALVLGKAVEALGVGYSAGDFINAVSAASDRELLDELERRLEGGGARAGSAAANQTGAGDLDNNPEGGRSHLRAVAAGDEGDEEQAAEASRLAREARARQQAEIDRMKSKDDEKESH